MSGATIQPDDIRWRVSNTWEKNGVKWGMVVGYIDARTCMDALDELDPAWSAVHGDPIIVGNELIGVPITLTVNGVTRSDVGMPSSQDPIKGAYSDALKRAAIHHGIGRELYELPKIGVECEVGANGKVKGPKALPVYRNGRWDIDRKVGWVRYDRDPDEQPEPSARGESHPGGSSYPSGAHHSAPAPDLRGQLSAAMKEHHVDLDGLERIADELGVPKGQKATDEQIRAMIARIQQPEQASARPAPASQAASSEALAEDPEPVVSLPDGAPGPTLDEVLEATGGELIPPRPGTDDYKALPVQERAAAKAYWSEQDAEAKRRPDAEQMKAAVTA